MMYRKEKTEKVLKEIIGTFIERESGPQSLITITKVDTTNKERNAIVFINVLPDDKEDIVLQFLSRKINELREYIKKNSALKILPFVEFRLHR